MKQKLFRWKFKLLHWKLKKVQVLLAVFAIGYAILATIGYRFRLNWTGFPNKTIWDWTVILVLPVVLSLSVVFLNRADQKSSQEIAQKRNDTERALAEESQRGNLLQSYFDKMSDLLLSYSLRKSAIDAEVRYIARSRTLTILPSLDGKRKGSLIRFLYESDLINVDDNIINLKGADLSTMELKDANLDGINLNMTDLRGANLKGCNLRNADLYKANLENANLSCIDLSGACLFETNLKKANMEWARLCNSILAFSDLDEANMRGAEMENADLRGSQVSYVDLTEANIKNAKLSMTLLTGSILHNTKIEKIETSGIDFLKEDLELLGAKVDIVNFISSTDKDIKDLRKACVDAHEPNGPIVAHPANQSTY